MSRDVVGVRSFPTLLLQIKSQRLPEEQSHPLGRSNNGRSLARGTIKLQACLLFLCSTLGQERRRMHDTKEAVCQNSRKTIEHQ